MNTFKIVVADKEYRISEHNGVYGTYTIYIYDDNNTDHPCDPVGLIASATVSSGLDVAFYDTPDGTVSLDYEEWVKKCPYDMAHFVVGEIT